MSALALQVLEPAFGESIALPVYTSQGLGNMTAYRTPLNARSRDRLHSMLVMALFCRYPLSYRNLEEMRAAHRSAALPPAGFAHLPRQP